MKRKLFLLLCALLTMIGVQAQETWNAPEIPGSDLSGTVTGNYAIYNVKADAFMGEGMNYNTEAIACRAEGNITAALANRQKFTLTVSASTVKMVHVNHNDRGVGCASANANDIYADYGSNNQWTFASSNTAPDYGNVYNLSIAGYGTLDVDDKWGGKLTTTGGPGNTDWAFIPEASITNGSFARWKEKKAMYDVYLALVASESTSTYADALSEANAVYTNGSATVDDLRAATRALIIAAADGIQQPTNVSALFTNADIQSKGSVTDWSSDNIDFAGGAVENHWAVTAITLAQEKVDLPNGLYTLVFHGMYRTGEGDAPYFKAVSGDNNSQVNLPLMSEMASRWSVRGTDEWAGADNNKIPNKLWRAAEGLAYEGASAKIENFKVTGNSLNLTVKVTSSAQWVPFQGFEIYYLGPANLALYKQVVEKKGIAEGLVSSAPNTGSANLLTNAIEEANSVSPSSTEDALNSALTDLNTAITFAGECVAPYATFTALKGKAQAIADVEYKETTTGSHSTFAGVISAQTSVADNATTIAAITTATSTLKTAIVTYINGAEPANDGEYFDVTCLMANPDFDDNTTTGWTKESSMNPNTRIQCNEFYGSAAFDFYQVVNGLPNGSYTLGMKAFQRPGGYNDVYAAWKEGINNATAKVYVNSDESDVKNIMAEMNATRIYTDPAGEGAFNSDKMPTGADGYIPNSMEGAAAWFAADKYKTEVAALVENGSLRLGFKDAAHSGDVWTLFDEFRLHYYGSSKLVYYKQYLPQLRAEVAADLTNNLYKNVLVSSEDEALDAALAAEPASETEVAYKTVIDNIKDAQTAFRAAAPSYDAMVAAQEAATLTKISTNIGTGVFQYNEATNNTKYGEYETAKGAVDGHEFTTSSTAAGAQALVDALNTAISNYQNQALNAPEAEKRYNIILTYAGYEHDGKAITYLANARKDMGNYNVQYLAAPNANYAQAFVLTQVEGNTYKMSQTDVDGNTRYLCTGTPYSGEAVSIRTTTTAEDALVVKIIATGTENVFNIYNTEANNYIGSQDAGVYTVNSHINFTISEASKATAKMVISAIAKMGTFCAPFDVTIPAEVKAYTVTKDDGKDYVTLEEVETTIDAGTPVLVEYTGTGSDPINVAFTDFATVNSAESGVFNGVFAKEAVTKDNNNYILQYQGGVCAFYLVESDDIYVGANRCYLHVDGGASLARIAIGGEDDPTAINAIKAADAETEGGLKDGKYLIGNKVVLVKNGVKYSANGQILK